MKKQKSAATDFIGGEDEPTVVDPYALLPERLKSSSQRQAVPGDTTMPSAPAEDSAPGKASTPVGQDSEQASEKPRKRTTKQGMVARPSRTTNSRPIGLPKNLSRPAAAPDEKTIASDSGPAVSGEIEPDPVGPPPPPVPRPPILATPASVPGPSVAAGTPVRGMPAAAGTPAGGTPAAAVHTPVPVSDPPSAPVSRSSGPTPSGTPSGKTAGFVDLPEPGAFINQYELIRELGRGGMGAVFLARDTKLGRRVAIKFLHSANPEVAVRFALEARLTAQFNHENIVTIHDSGEYGSNLFMVLEYMQGSPLTKLMGKGNRLSPSRAVEIMAPVARALARAHLANVVHRDLKPDNIFLTDSGTVKVLDFGIAKAKGTDSGLADIIQKHHPEILATKARAEGKGKIVEDTETSNTELTKAGALMGTLSYMSPEQWGAGEVDHRTDIWAAGIILYRMLTGRHPLAPLRGWQLMVTAALDQPMPSIRDVAVDVPGGLAEVVDRCLIKDVEQRMPDAETLLGALESLLPGRYTRRLSTDVSPYAGLSAFQEADADRFFGRSKEIASMAARLRDRPLIAVVGPSGVGKSSFVRAGVVPALKQSGEHWDTQVVRPGRQPMAALANIVAPMVSDATTNMVDDVSEQQASVQRLYSEPETTSSTPSSLSTTRKRSSAKPAGRRVQQQGSRFC